MTKDALNSLCWPAMRYALGRKTYVVHSVCRALISNKDAINVDTKARMCEEIELAIVRKEAGMDCDVIQWELVLEAFKPHDTNQE